MKGIILFDLDGTLTDPKAGITRSVQYALKAYGIDEPDLDKLCPFIGPPLTDSFREFYGFTPEAAAGALRKYREYFSVTGIFENEVYDGIPQMLERLKEEGFTLAVATSKPEQYAEQILEHFDLKKYFKVVGGADMSETRVKKGDVIAYTLKRLSMDTKKAAGAENILNANEVPVLMVGDRMHDVQGAKENGLPCVGVLFGYGSREELLEAGAEYLAETVENLSDVLAAWGQKNEMRQRGPMMEAGVEKKKQAGLAPEEAAGLIGAAFAALPQAYAPYSGFCVAAALLCEDGTIYTGVNIENASYPAGNCAERTAIFKAVSEGYRKFRAIAICGGKNGRVTDYCAPCGICRQVMREFCEPETFVILLPKTETDYREYRLKELLPLSFGPESLG